MTRRAALAAGLLLAGSSAGPRRMGWTIRWWRAGVDEGHCRVGEDDRLDVLRQTRLPIARVQGCSGNDSAAFGRIPGVAVSPRSFGGHSGATAEIDRSREEFVALSDHLETFAAELSRAADEAPDRLTDDMRMGDHVPMGGSLLGRRPGRDADADPSTMPAEHVFHPMLEDCASCHAKFREKAE